MKNYLPFLEWVSTYKKEYLAKDLAAGFTVGIILVPQAMAYAMVAGLPPVYGLYASIFPVIVYALLGTSRAIAIGPVAMDSLLVATGLGSLGIVGAENYIAMAAGLALVVGTIQFTLGVFRMGFLVNFLSKPVISGFTSAAAVIIILSQLKHLLGAPIPSSSRFHILVGNLMNGIGGTNFYDLAIGLLGIALLIFLKKWNNKIPSILVVVVMAMLGVYFFHLEDYGIQLVGSVPSGLPHFQMPHIAFEDVKSLWPIALALSLVGYLEAISIGKALEDRSNEDTVRPNQELIALGSSNMMASIFQGYSVTGSFSRSAISYEAGAKTNLAGIFSTVMVLLTLLFLTPIFKYLPNAVLASIIMVSVVGLIDVRYAKNLWATRRDEFAIWLLSFLITLFVGIAEGILVGVLVSLLLMVYRTSKPHMAVLEKIKDSDYYKNVKRFAENVEIREDLLIVRFDSQLYFGNASYFKNELKRLIQEKGKNLKAIILNAEAINYIDATGADTLAKVIRESHDKGLQFYIAGAIGPTRDVIFDAGIINELHTGYLFVKTNEAVAFYDDPNSVSPIGTRIAHENSKHVWEKFE